MTENKKTVVLVRSRPLFVKEKQRNCKRILQFPSIDASGCHQILLAGDKGFELDRVFTDSCNQEDIFGEVKPIIQHVKQGYNATILAYGQTGAGKTYTMGVNKRSSEVIRESDGIVPRIIQTLFQECRDDTSVQIFVSFMEVYNEEVYDLLAPVPTKLSVKGFKVQNLTEVAVYSENDAFCRLEEGIEGRRFCATQANAQSSRSHAIFSLHLHRSLGMGSISSTLHLVDLAGSESVKKTGNQGIAFLEGININKGLLSLGKVIAARADKQQGHVPFRDSVLTSVLKDSLCGMSYMTIIACVSPSDADIQETLNTLRFVQRARKIMNQPKINRAITDNAEKIKEFQSLLQSIPKTPANWKHPSATGRTVKGTPLNSIKRKPLAAINFSLPSPMTPSYNIDNSHLSFMSVKSTRSIPSPPLSLPNISIFEPSLCSSSVSFATAKDNTDQDISVLMNTLISEKIEELRTQTEVLIERKVQDTIRAMKVSSVSSQNQPAFKNCSTSMSPTSISDVTLLGRQFPVGKSIACQLFSSSPEQRHSSPYCSKENYVVSDVNIDVMEEIKENSNKNEVSSDHSTIPRRRRSMRISELYQPAFAAAGKTPESPTFIGPSNNVKPKRRKSMRIAELYKSAYIDVTTSKTPESPILTESPHYVFSKRRRSMRISGLHKSAFVNNSEALQSSDSTILLDDSSRNIVSKRRKSMRIEELRRNTTLADELNRCIPPVPKRRRSSLSMRSYRMSQNRISDTSQASPGMNAFLKAIQPPIIRHQRNKRRHSMADASQQTTPESLQQKKSRNSLAAVANKRYGRKSIMSLLEKKLAVPSPSRGNVQATHNKNVLKFLNTENLRGLQQLPTVGPKTAFIIFNFRKLNGPFKNITDLKTVPGLAKTYCNRFKQANNVNI